MENKIEEYIQAVFRHSANFGVHLIPGTVILDMVFKQGFFSHRITSWLDLIFVIFWGYVLSIPFHYKHPQYFFRQLKRKVYLSRLKKPEDIELQAVEIELEFVLSKLIFFYLIFKFLSWQLWIQIPFIIGINPTITMFFISVCVSNIIGYKIICFLIFGNTIRIKFWLRNKILLK